MNCNARSLSSYPHLQVGRQALVSRNVGSFGDEEVKSHHIIEGVNSLVGADVDKDGVITWMEFLKEQALPIISARWLVIVVVVVVVVVVVRLSVILSVILSVVLSVILSVILSVCTSTSWFACLLFCKTILLTHMRICAYLYPINVYIQD